MTQICLNQNRCSYHLTWFTTSKKMPSDVLGYNPHIFHWHVPPRPISVSDTDWPFTPSETHGPMAPDTLSSRDVCKTWQSYSMAGYHRLFSSHNVYKIQHNLPQTFSALTMPAKYRKIYLKPFQLSQCLQNIAQSTSDLFSSHNACKIQHNLPQTFSALTMSTKYSTICLRPFQLSQRLKNIAQSTSDLFSSHCVCKKTTS